MRPTSNISARPPQIRPVIIRRPNEVPQFPDCVERALKSISQHVNMGIDPKFKRSKEKELQTKLDVELFGLSPDLRQTYWQPLQRFKLLNFICDFYLKLPAKKDASKRYEYFDIIFCGREGSGPAHDHRISVLTSLSSLAIQFPCYLLFDDIATWFMKIQSNVYAKKIVNSLFEDFVLAPIEYNLIKDLHPLRENAFEFSCYFIVYSISERNLCPQLALLIGEWITEEPSEIFSFIAENSTLRQHFKEECVSHLILYDVKRSLDDDIHDQFHCAITYLLLQWKSVNAKNEETSRKFELDETFNQLIADSNTLEEFQRVRLVQNIRNALKMGHYDLKKFNQYKSYSIFKEDIFDDFIDKRAD